MDSYKYEDAKRKATLQTKKEIKKLGYNNVIVKCVRGIFHLTNGNNYGLTASNILSQSTGFIFLPMGDNMAKLDKTQF